MSRPLALLALLLSFPLAGCVGGPSYAGGPTTDQPHAIVDMRQDVTLWRVDGHDVETRHGETYLQPGLRSLKIRIEADIEDETATPFEYRTISLHAKDGVFYTIGRKEGDLPPWEIDIRQFKLR